MFNVETNKYSHSGSGFSRVDSEHETIEAAIEAADKLWKEGQQRFVVVQVGPTVYYKSGKSWPKGILETDMWAIQRAQKVS